MGKKQKIRAGAGDVVAMPGPLDKQIEKSKLAKPKIRLNPTPKNDMEMDEAYEERNEEAVDPKILKFAQKQWSEEVRDRKKSQPRLNIRSDGRIALKNLKKGMDSDEEPDDEDDEILRNVGCQDEELMQLNEEDEAAINKFLVTEPKKEKTLFDIIQEKIGQKKVAFEQQFEPIGGPNNDIQVRDLNPDVVALYKEVGAVMAHYRSGKVPKAFKMIPNLVNWEQILELTCPDNWSAASMLQATRLFSACMNMSMCQRFYNLVLLPRVRDEIQEYKKLSFHIYQCVFKAMYKPAAFFKGILLPLCDSGNCTLREAAIFGSVLRKVSIPVLHAAAAMLKIAEMEYTGSSSYFLRVLIEKRYTLPFRAIDGLVFHFLNMRTYKIGVASSERVELPVLWHQALLSFVQIYKRDISSEQREALLELLKVQVHHQITPEIRRHLQNAESRNEESEANVPEYAREDEMEH